MGSKEMYSYEPDYVTAPGETLKETLEYIGMTQIELAKRTGRPAKTINEIIKGTTAITLETARQFESVLDIPADFWVSLENNYRAYLLELKEKEELKEEISWLDKFPIKELMKRGIIKDTKDKVKQLRDLFKFFGVVSIDSFDTTLGDSTSFRKSETFNSDMGAIHSWVRLVEIESSKIECEAYDRKVFKSKLHEIRSLTTEVDPKVFIGHLKELCAESGVAVAFVPEIKGCRASGVTKWLNPKKAMIGLSLRHKTNDHLWFTFFHEAAHILLHSKKDVFIEGIKSEDEKEKEANEFAADFLISAEVYNEFTVTSKPVSKAKVLKFAEEIGIAPGIVVGRLQRDGFLQYTHLNGLKARYTW